MARRLVPAAPGQLSQLAGLPMSAPSLCATITTAG
jgi:hypothetical protein